MSGYLWCPEDYDHFLPKLAEAAGADACTIESFNHGGTVGVCCQYGDRFRAVMYEHHPFKEWQGQDENGDWKVPRSPTEDDLLTAAHQLAASWAARKDK